jgi:AcrR family transcriptional regulator
MYEMFQSGNAAETTDPRIVRSRRMLMEALGRLLTRKAFDDISIQEIADEASLNRATFYLRYPDKQALLRAMTGARFGELIAVAAFPSQTATVHCVPSRLASATISQRVRDAQASWQSCRLKALLFRSWRVCFGKALPSTQWRPVPTPNYWQPLRPGPSSGRRAAGTRPPTDPPRRWLPKLKRW